ncbi:MAG: hypothetical protein KAI17_28035, partial [Thiotrichaceae bacterium]|nr:hypothetical protein [Thiotrichaceae bacterium]
MKQKAILSFCCITLVITTFLTSCDSAGGQVNNNNPEIVRQSASCVTETDINNSASCWLHSLDKSFDEWVGDGECTALARFLTKAPGYGKDQNGGFLGGADYVIQQQKKGIHIPLLAEIKSDIKPCDNLILVGPKYVTAGHTVVVFYPDLVNDKIYYLDQNYHGDGITLRSLSVSENENSTYVISAECKPDNQELIKCQSDGTQGPLIAAPGPSAPAQPELSTTLVSATVQAPSNNSSAFTPTPEPVCKPGTTIQGALDNRIIGHFDMLSVSTALDGITLTAVFTLRDIPDVITINADFVREKCPDQGWVVYIDTDNNPDTGSVYSRGSVGHEYSLQASNSNHEAERSGSIEDLFRDETYVWIHSNRGSYSGDSGRTIVDQEAKTITLIGDIEGITPESRLHFYTYSPSVQTEDFLCQTFSSP